MKTPSNPRWLTPIRWLWFILAFGYTTLWLASLPQFYTQVSTLTVNPYRLGERVIYDNASVAEAMQQRGLSASANAAYTIALVAAQVGVYLAISTLIILKSSSNFSVFTAFTLVLMPTTVTQTAINVASPFPGAGALMSLPGYVIYAVWALWLTVFPSGQIVPRRFRWPVIIAMALFTLLQIVSFSSAQALIPPGFDAFVANTLGPSISIPIFAFIFFSQIYRYRHVSTAMERQQTKWFLFVIGLFVLGLIIFVLARDFVRASRLSQDFFSLVSLMFPVVVAISILRYRLFDIDLLIRRTLQYSVLSGLLALTYFGSITVLQRLFFANQQSEISIVLSTLAIAALFFPLRNRVQEFIDKQFYRKKYDAQKVLAEFAATCRDETDLDKLVARLAEVIDETLQPEKVSVWIRPTADSGRSTSDPTRPIAPNK